MSTKDEAERQFLIGLEKLSRETGVYIGGCGCCGSPFLSYEPELNADPRAGYCSDEGKCGKVTWIDPGDNYDWENYKEEIVK